VAGFLFGNAFLAWPWERLHKALAFAQTEAVTSRTAFEDFDLPQHRTAVAGLASNSVCSSTASAAAAGAAIHHGAGGSAAETPKASSICLTSSEASSRERVSVIPRIVSVLVRQSGGEQATGRDGEIREKGSAQLASLSRAA